MEAVSKIAANATGSIGGDLPEYYIEYYLNILPHLSAIVPIGKALNFNEKTNILEIGSGIGTRCLLGNALWGSQFTGVEPCLHTFSPLLEAIVEFQKANVSLSYQYVNARGEDIKIPDNSFNHVLSFDVLEHVQDPKKVISEAYRLVKPGGKFFFSTVNYFSFYEGHYRIPWVPGLNRKIASKWVKLFGRNPKFLDEINFITRMEISNYLNDAGFRDIKFGYDYPSISLPQLIVNYPEGFFPPATKIHKSVLQVYIQHPRIHNILSNFNMEYKLYIEAKK